MKTIAAVSTSLMLAGCSGGDDVYVRESTPTDTVVSSLGCEVTAGADMCSRTLDGVPDAQHARVLDALQAISDFAAISDRALAALGDACRSIVLETTGTLPLIPLGSTPEQIVEIRCGAASEAIEGGGLGRLTITIKARSCPSTQAVGCAVSTAVLPPSGSCRAEVSVVPKPGAPASATVVGTALWWHLEEILEVEEVVASLSRVSATIVENSDAYTMLPATCASSATTLASKSTHRISAMTAAHARLANAVDAVSH